MEDLHVVIFRLNNELCGAETSQVTEILKYQEAEKVPKMPRFLDGLINLRGRIIPVINLNKRFELGETDITKKTKIIITQINDGYLGYIVNDVTEIVRFTKDELELTPEIINKTGNTYMKYVGKKGEKIVSILDLKGILSDKETVRLKTVSKN